MTLQALAIAVVAGAVAILVAAELAGRRVAVVAAKSVASTAFVCLALLRADPSSGFDRRVVAALALCLLGDLLLLAPRAFAAGLATFLAAHLAYAAAFSALLGPRAWPLLPLAVFVLAGGATAVWLWPHLGTMRVPVLAYVAAITVMAWGAIAVAPRTGWLTGLAGPLFFLSDLAVARDRLVVRRFSSRAWGLPAYYLAQVLFALALGR